jgi:hypothetical protein
MKARRVLKGLAGAVALLLVYPLAAFADNVKPDGDLTLEGRDVVLTGCVLPSADVRGHIAVKRNANDKAHFSPGQLLTASYSVPEQVKVDGPKTVTVPDEYTENGKSSEFYIPITTQVLSGPEQGSGSVQITLSNGTYHESGSYNVSWDCAGVKDTTPPTLILPDDITVEATSSAGANVEFQVTAIDDVSENPTVECSAASGDLFPLGTTTVTCTATDEAGNTSDPGSFNVTVVVGWGGFLQPLNPGGPASFKLNSTIPVKFQLGGASTGITDLDARLFFQPVGGGDKWFDATSTSGATTGNAFRWDADGGFYIFNLNTKAIGKAGTYVLRVDLGDGVPHNIQVEIRK